MVKNALVGFCAFCAFCGGSEKLGQGPGVMGDRPDLPLLALTDYLSVFMFLVFFVAAIRLEARGKRSEVRGERLEVIGPIRISVSRFLLSPVSSFPPSPLRVTSRPSRLKMPWLVLCFSGFSWRCLGRLCAFCGGSEIELGLNLIASLAPRRP